jgi:hypothetical protein
MAENERFNIMQLKLKRKIITSVLVAFCTLSGFGKNLELVKNGKAYGKIVLYKTASLSEKLACKELNYYIEKISGASLPVNEIIT